MNVNNTVLAAEQSSRPSTDPTQRALNDQILENAAGTTEVPSTKGIVEYCAAEHPETPAAPRVSDNEPHGMYWHALPSGDQILKPHAWFISEIANTADAVFVTAHESMARDSEAKQWITDLKASLGEYILTRTAINDKAGDRKLKQEADDAAYQLCQAAKFYIDATERAKRDQDRGINLDSDSQLLKLREMAEVAMREGYILGTAVATCTDKYIEMNMMNAARRVAEYSAKRLTDWYATQRRNTRDSDKHQNAGAALDLSKFFKRAS